MGDQLKVLALTPAGYPDASIAIAASRAGGVGVYNAEIDLDPGQLLRELRRLADHAKGPFGLKIAGPAEIVDQAVDTYAARGLQWIVLDARHGLSDPAFVKALQARKCTVLFEITEWDDRLANASCHDGLIVKGHEAGGRVGEESTFILLQKALARQTMPVYARGGIGLHGAAAAYAGGAAGVVLDNQLLLLKESALKDRAGSYLRNFSGLETGLISADESGGWRVFEMPGFAHVKELRAAAADMDTESLDRAVLARHGWNDPASEFVLLGQDAAFASSFATRFKTVGGVVRALQTEASRRLEFVTKRAVLARDQGIAESYRTTHPIVQGPMTRVSDTAAFAQAVAEGGAMPMLALALMKPSEVERLLAEVSTRLAGRPWGVGLLGFAPADLIAGQTAAVRKFGPSVAIVAGGRPDQVRGLEAQGIASFLHVPTPRLLKMFIEEGSTRFVFEGRECGGHVGPLTSFVLWDLMVDVLLEVVPASQERRDLQVLFAGGIHDARSAAMVSALVGPLTERGIHIGVLMGSAYLFTKEIVESGAVVPNFQKIALACETTARLETGPGHASRCAVTPFATEFFAEKRRLQKSGKNAEEVREVLDDLSLGRLRLASKAKERAGENGAIHDVPGERQLHEGMYMIGEVATLVDRVSTIADLHDDVIDGAQRFLEQRLAATKSEGEARSGTRPCDIAVIGLGAVLPKARNVREYWDNILGSVDAIAEIPAHRWDWRLYFDENRDAPDKIYSKWGGFLDDMVFDPMRYGVPPNAIKAIDPLQLMSLEVIRACLEDAGYADRSLADIRVSVILGASGGAGDVGAQYAVRAEMPRFAGELDADVAARLPEWTEDSFAGILLNVTAGRAANRFDFNGVNFTVDAACASSLAAVYQGVIELETGRSDMVIVGGVDTVQGPFGYLCFSKTKALSPRGRCATFNADADGIVISEGIAMLAIKRLGDAERDGDRIYAVIKGAAGSSDGRAKSMTAPLPEGQMRALARTYEMAGYAPTTVELFEAHGTGTVAGDTAELESTSRLLASHGSKPRQSAVGSVKTLIGHTKATAGVAGLMKAVLACYHQVLPPHGRVEVPNAKLAEPDFPLYLLSAPQPWVRNPGTPRRASVSSFGFGGTNFHVTLEEYGGAFGTDARESARHRWPCELLVWRAPDRAQLAATIRALAERLAGGMKPTLRDLAFSLAASLPKDGRTAAIVVKDSEAIEQRLLALVRHLENQDTPLPPGAFYSDAPLAQSGGKLALIFPGQGSQYPNMFRDVAVLFPEMRDCIERADEALFERMPEEDAPGRRLSRAIFPAGAYSETEREAAAERLTRTNVAQPALGAVETGLWHVLRRFGVKADMAAGHSYGEYVALHAADVLTLKDLFVVSEARGRFMIEAAQGGDLGTMAAVQADRKTVESFFSGKPDLCIANHNAPLETIISGSRAAIDQAVSELTAQNIKAKRLRVGAAFHSPIVSPASDRLGPLIGTFDLGTPSMAVFSNTTARAYPTDATAIRDLLTTQLTSTVEFVSETIGMYDAGARIFLSVGPRSAHANMVRQILADKPVRVITTDDEEGGLRSLLQALGALLAEGVSLDLSAMFAGRDCIKFDIDQGQATQRHVAPAAHHWLLNGSGARRASDPRRSPLTINDIGQKPRVDASAAPKSENGDKNERRETGKAQPAPSTAPVTAIREGKGLAIMTSKNDQLNGRVESATEPRAEAIMDYSERESILSKYQETMRQFLQSHENVMLAYLAGVPNSRPASAWRALPRQAHPVAPAGARRLPPAAEPIIARPENGKDNGHPAQNGSADQMPYVQMTSLSPRAPEPQPAPANAGNGKNGTHATNGGTGSDGTNGAAKPQASGAPAAASAADKKPMVFKRETITSELLGLVEERTGYPPEMLGMDQNLEADLGIDSIKKVEIVGALLKTLPSDTRAALGDIGENLTKQKTLQGIVTTLMQGLEGPKEGNTRPFELTGAGEKESACPPRFVMQAQSEIGDGEGSLPSGIFVVTNDGKGLADAVADQIAKAGAQAVILNPSALSDPERIQTALAELDIKRVVGLVHLAALNGRRLRLDANPSDWRSEIERNEFSAYFLIKHLGERLHAGGRVILASGLGGHFGRDAAPHAGFLVQGGLSGLAKSLKEEWPQCSLKAVDLDSTANVAVNAGHIIAELRRPGGRIEVGYPGGTRTVFTTVTAPFDPKIQSRFDLDASWVVLATGGARGVTAQICISLAATGATLILAGRAPLPGPESPETRDLQTVDALRRHFIVRSKASAGAPTKIADIENAVRAVVQDREITRNIEDMRKAGAKVIYRQVDVRDHGAVGTMLAGLYGEFGHIDGVLHGAGVIEDRLLVDKTPESWRRVVGTKVDGALALLRHLRLDELKFLSFLTSVAGRYGNRGQSDYAMANELLNRIAWQVHAAHRPNLKVSSINWGPWLGTRHGSGMVSDETRRKFEAKGLRLVDPDGGAEFFLEEILRGPGEEVEVIAGVGTWEQHESHIAGLPIPAVEVPATPATTRQPLVFKASQETAAKGGIRLPRRLSLETDPYLNQHKLAGVPVLPIAIALEMMAEAAEQVWPDWHVAEMVDLRVLHGVQLDEGPSRDIEIVVSASQHGDAEGFLASVELRSGDGKGRRHYRASAQMRSKVPQPEPSKLTIVPRRSPVTALETYRKILFHGPCFQTITDLSGLDESGAAAQVRSTQPREFIPTAPPQARWLFDPGLVDAALQLGWTWSQRMNAKAALCNGIGRVRRFAPGLPSVSTMKVAARKVVSETGFQADVEVTGPDGKLLLTLEQLDFTSSENLNRLSGWHGEIRIAPEPSA